MNHDDLFEAASFSAVADSTNTTKYSAYYDANNYWTETLNATAQSKRTLFNNDADASFLLALQSSGVTKDIFSLSPQGLKLGEAALTTDHRLETVSTLTATGVGSENIHGAKFTEIINTAYALTTTAAVVSSVLDLNPSTVTLHSGAGYQGYNSVIDAGGTGGWDGQVSSYQSDIDVTGASGTWAGLNGVATSVTLSGGASVTHGRGVQVSSYASAGTLSNFYGVQVLSPSVTGTGAISTSYGLYVQNQYVAGVTTAYGVYVAGANTQNYFQGQVTAGSVVISGLGAGSGNSVIVEEGYELRRRTIDSAVWSGSYLSGFTTDNLTQGATNKYYSDGLARTALSGTVGRISYSSSTGVIDIAATYAGQATITTLGTISSGTWQGSSINTTYTQAKVISVSAGTGISVNQTTGALTVTNSDRGSSQNIFKGIANSAGTVQFSAASNNDAIRFAAGGDTSISFNAGTKTVTFSSSGGTTYTEGTGIDITGTTISIDTLWAGQAAITTVGTITTGVWQGSSIATTYTAAKVTSISAGTGITVTGGTGAATVSINTAYTGQTSITTLGIITSGTWQGSVIGTAYTTAQVQSVTAGTGIAVSNGTTNASVSIAASWAGQSAITTVGNITSGQWSATTIASTKGGTGLTSYATGDLIYASSTNLLTTRSIGTEGYVLKVVSGVPAWAAESGGVSNAFKFIDDEVGTTKITASGEDDFYVGDCGGITINWGAGGFIVDGSGISDRKLKKEIRNTLKNQCSTIIKSVPVKRFKWRNDVADNPKFNRKFLKKNADQIGFIADELKAVVPDAVIYNKHFECEAIVEKDLVKILWGAVNELIERIEVLEQA